jgi:putative transposase
MVDKSTCVDKPAHSYVDDAPYFITAATHQHQKLLDDENKAYLRDILHTVFAEYGWTLDAWVILDNHYHLLGNSRKGRDLTRIINKIHNQTAQRINQRFPPRHRASPYIWCNYWDYNPRNEREYNARLCYLLNNPRQHGYVERLQDWPWSSFAATSKLRELFEQHREYRTLIIPEDDFS